ncbi:sel1 repeat family protein [Massilia sp. H-1]|nr:sel1 repeat family protein [Massilia sp. H-1]
MGSVPGVGQCMGQLAFANGDFESSAKALSGEPGIADDSPIVRQLAWSQFYNNNSGAALATMARYQAARSKAHGNAPSAGDAADQIALFSACLGQPLPAELEQFARAIPDGPWPRPVLAMQLGLISADQLIGQAEALPADASEIALTEAWFYIGQARLAAKDAVGAKKAFRWYLNSGVRGSGFPAQAKAELRRLQAPNPGLEATAAARDKNMEAAVAAWKPGADAGLAENQFAMGVALMAGSGVAKDMPQAFRWMTLAAAQEQPEAMFALGAMYEDGAGVTASQSSALDWYRKAAALGQSEAQFTLGHRYRYGRGVERDAGQALRRYRAAAGQGHSGAMASLGEMYGRG